MPQSMGETHPFPLHLPLPPLSSPLSSPSSSQPTFIHTSPTHAADAWLWNAFHISRNKKRKLHTFKASTVQVYNIVSFLCLPPFMSFIILIILAASYILSFPSCWLIMTLFKEKIISSAEWFEWQCHGKDPGIRLPFLGVCISQYFNWPDKRVYSMNNKSIFPVFIGPSN